MEVYRGRPIFHGLGNFVSVTRALTPTMTDNAERQEWARRRQQLYGFAPDPDMPAYPFHPQSRNTAIAVLREVDGQLAAGLVPCWIDEDARPVPLARANGEADLVLGYIESISSGWFHHAVRLGLRRSGDRRSDILNRSARGALACPGLSWLQSSPWRRRPWLMPRTG